GDDDVCHAVADLDVAVGVHERDVSGVGPAAREGAGGRFGVIEVALHHVVAAHHGLAHGLAVAGHVVHLGVHDADRVGDEVVHPLAAEQPRPVLSGHGRPALLRLAHSVGGVGLGQAVDVHGLEVERGHFG